jgi:hypothetical protein
MEERERTPKKEVDSHATLSELQRLLKMRSEVFGNQLPTIQEAVEDAKAEIEKNGKMSQGMAERLDDLFRPFKPDSLK